jgi:hypothetical protein
MMSPSVARRTIATPVLLGLLLIAFALVAVAVGSKPFNQTVIDIFLKVIFVVGLWVFVGNSGVISFGHIAFACLGGYVAAWTTIKPMMKGMSMPGLPDWLMQTEIPYWGSAMVAAGWAALWALIFGSDYEQQPGVFAVLVFGGLLNMLLATVGPIFWAIGRPSLDRACQIPRVIAIFAIGFALVPGMGGMGMAIAMSVSSGIALMYGYRLGLKVVHLRWFDPVRYCADLLAIGLIAGVLLLVARWLPGLDLPMRIALFGLVSIPYALWTLRAAWSMYTQMRRDPVVVARPESSD